MQLLRQLFGNAQGVSAALHLRIHFGWIDVRAVPEHDEVVQQIGTLANEACGPTFDGLKRDLASLFDDFLRRPAAA